MRCVNIDWLEVSCEESPHKSPCDADYFRSHGYFVQERDYGTRVWSQVFVIEDDEGKPWIEVRRCPPSGKSDFTGLNEFSCRLRLVNAACYIDDCVERLRAFMLKHDYVFKKIYRIDVCYDFEYFDYGDAPARFARLYIEKKFRKINQAKLSAHAADNWSAFEWESLSWGSKTSMVSTKMYNKSKEIKEVSKEKVYIIYAWFVAGLIDDPINMTKRRADGTTYEPEIWRVEFSMTSKAERWLVIEDQSGKRVKKKAVQHTLDMFDSKDKLWQRFQDLAFHYFRFVVAKKKQKIVGLASLALQSSAAPGDQGELRKDLCPQKRLFRFDKDREFLHLDNCPTARKQSRDDDVLKRRLISYRLNHLDEKIRQACDVILKEIKNGELKRISPKQLFSEVEALRRTLALRLHHPDVNIVETAAELQQLLFNDEIF